MAYMTKEGTSQLVHILAPKISINAVNANVITGKEMNSTRNNASR